MATINDLSEATQMQIELMRWETEYLGKLPSLNGNRDELRDLIERNPEYVARAWQYFPRVIINATSKKQILMAWVCGESDSQEDAARIYDEAMASNLSIAKVRKQIKEANGHAAPHKPSLAERDADRVLRWRAHKDYTDPAIDYVSELADDPTVAIALAKREAK